MFFIEKKNLTLKVAQNVLQMIEDSFIGFGDEFIFFIFSFTQKSAFLKKSQNLKRQLSFIGSQTFLVSTLILIRIK